MPICPVLIYCGSFSALYEETTLDHVVKSVAVSALFICISVSNNVLSYYNYTVYRYQHSDGKNTNTGSCSLIHL